MDLNSIQFGKRISANHPSNYHRARARARFAASGHSKGLEALEGLEGSKGLEGPGEWDWGPDSGRHDKWHNRRICCQLFASADG